MINLITNDYKYGKILQMQRDKRLTTAGMQERILNSNCLCSPSLSKI